MKRAKPVLWALITMLAMATPVLAAPAAVETESLSLPGYLLTWLWPLGVALVLVGISEGWSINDVASMLLMALALAVLTEMLSGYGLHHSGSVLDAEWEPFGSGWGLFGRAGLLTAANAASSVLLFDLPLMTVALLPPLVVLRGRRPAWLRRRALPGMSFTRRG